MATKLEKGKAFVHPDGKGFIYKVILKKGEAFPYKGIVFDSFGQVYFNNFSQSKAYEEADKRQVLKMIFALIFKRKFSPRPWDPFKTQSY
jgi:hypothetical protein